MPSSTPGYSNAVNGLVLSAKHSTNTRSRPSNQVWDRVAQAASSSSPLPSTLRGPLPPKFPALPNSGQTGTPFRQSQRTTPWAGSSVTTRPTSTTSTTPAPAILSQNVSKAPSRPSALSKHDFPGLPANQNSLPKGLFSGNKSAKNIVGEVAPSAWNSAGATGTFAQEELQDQSTSEAAGRKKNKGKQKQTLFTMGTFHG